MGQLHTKPFKVIPAVPHPMSFLDQLYSWHAKKSLPLPYRRNRPSLSKLDTFRDRLAQTCRNGGADWNPMFIHI